jgi:hypothetical protein
MVSGDMRLFRSRTSLLQYPIHAGQSARVVAVSAFGAGLRKLVAAPVLLHAGAREETA